LRQPGHIFPLMSQPGGVLTRAGHTEAGCDLVRLAGLAPAAVIVEILNDDGAMARRDDLVKFARRHELKIGTIADLIEYRLRTEESVEVIGETDVETEFGPFRLVSFEDHVNRAVHLALARGKLDAKTPTLVRVHRQDTLSDVLGLHAPTLHRPLRDALKLIAEADHGVVVVLRLEETARDLMRAVQSLNVPPEPEAGAKRQRGMDFRTFGIGAQIVRALGVRRMRVVGAPKQMHALSGFGLEVVEYVSDAAEREDSHG
jgi:3,4-dihydroxy 2-butanone 4-phosphate synthase/GTP cyclohydrolase II